MGGLSRQRTVKRRPAWLGALAVSVLLHSALVWTATPIAPRPVVPVAPEVTFELAALPPVKPAEPAPTNAAVEEAGDVRGGVHRARHAPQRQHLAQPSEPSVAAKPPAAATSATASASAPAIASASVSSVVDASHVDAPPPAISPRDAARTVVALPSRAQETIEAATALSSYLQDFASARPHLDRRSPPVLKPLPDGGYAYAGPGFAAHVRRDGSVQFIDRVLHPDGRVSFPNDPEKFGVLFTPFRFDLTDAMLRAMGEQLYPAEKRWFLEQTQALREQLEADDRLQLFARARRQLRDALMDIVNDAQRSSYQKRDAVFALWADCSDDEVGARGRHVIEAFVREHFAAASPNAFTAGELARLNQRNAHRRFDPYAQAKPSAD